MPSIMPGKNQVLNKCAQSSSPNLLPIHILRILQGRLPPIQTLARPLLFIVITTFFEFKQLAGSAP